MHSLSRDPNKLANWKYAKSARIISDVVSPPMVYAFLGFVFAWASLPFWQGLLWGALYGFFVSLLPLLSVIYLLKTGRVGDLHMSDNHQRRIPYLIGISGAIFAFATIYLFKGPDLLESLAIGTIIGLTTLSAINYAWLISNHMASITMAVLLIGSVFGLIFGLALIPFILAVFYARWVLGRHTILQLLAGMAVGVITVWVMVITKLI